MFPSPLRAFGRVLALLAALAACTADAFAVRLSERMERIPIGTRAEILEDAAGALTLEDVRTGPARLQFRAVDGRHINLGYRSGTLWVRLQVERTAAIGPWNLEIDYPLLDRVELYAPGVSMPMLGGDHTRLSDRPLADRHIIFPVEAPEPGVNTYLLRIRTDGSLNAPLYLWDHETFESRKRDEIFVLGAFYGLLAAMVLYNLFLFAIVRDPAYAAYVVYVGAMGFLIGVSNGFGGLYLWPESPGVGDWAQVAAAPLACATAALFTRLFLRTAGNAPRTDAGLRAIAVAGFTLVATGVALPRGFVFYADHLLALVTIATCLAAGVHSALGHFRPARFYLIAFICVLVGAAFMVARNLGLPANFLTDYGIQIGSALEVVLLSMGLADRISMLRKEKEFAQNQAIVSRERLLQALRESERELESRVAARTAELEALNQSLHAEISERGRTAQLLRESEERMRHQAQHDPLTGLPNRLLLRDRLTQAVARAKRDRGAFAALLVDLDNFKAVNDTLGHDVGDLLLIEVARRLEGCIREIDTIARLGGDEFVLVLEQLNAPEDSALVARKILEVLADPFPIAGELLRTSPSIGISLYPDDGQDSDFLIKFADIAMYRAKAAGRSCYRFYRDPEELHAYDQKVP